MGEKMSDEMVIADRGQMVAQNNGGMMSLKQITDRVNLVHQVLEKVMIGPSGKNPNGVHYGTVPGCGSKMVLLKPGADLLAMTFRLVPQFRVERTDLMDAHREYCVTCSMYGPDGALLGQGVGSGSTMEKKYRYRSDGGVKGENPDIADTYNTVLKMAKKRAHIDATLTVTGAADLFTQDLIDEDSEASPAKAPYKAPEKKATATAATGDAKTVKGKIESVEEVTGEKNGKPWTKYGIKINGAVYGTFIETLGADAKDSEGLDCELDYTTNGKFNNAVAIRIQSDDLPL